MPITRYNGKLPQFDRDLIVNKPPRAAGTVFDAIQEFNSDRLPELIPLKLKRLNKSVFCFFRGTDELFGKAWKALKPNDPGPVIQCTGDLHLENFGACQSSEGDFRFEINDFDESVVAPCSFDLIRCTASILLAGEDWKLTPVTATGIALAFLENYSQAVVRAVETGVVGEISPLSGEGPIWDLLNVTSRGAEQVMLDNVTRKRNGIRQIIRSAGKHPNISQRRWQKVCNAMESYGKTIGKPDAYRVLDVSARIAGIGSLGLRRYTVLIAGGGSPATNRMLDVKQVKKSAVANFVEVTQPKYPTEAHRTVAAQLQLQSKPALGLGVITMGANAYRVREMIPDENRSNIESLHEKPRKLREAVEVVGQLVGWSQVRGARHPGHRGDTRKLLANWARGPGIEAVLAAAVRFADLTRTQYAEYRRNYRPQR